MFPADFEGQENSSAAFGAKGSAQTGMDDAPSEATREAVLETALQSFASLGFAKTRLEEIARESGMSKRMIHYHFGDKRGLYNQCIIRAIQLLRPTALEMQIDSNVPVEGIRKVVEAVFGCYVDHPQAARLLAIENIYHHGTMSDANSLLDQSPTFLQLDKLLMVGQDSGAFRPGIAAQDIFTLIASLAHFRINARYTTMHLYGMDYMDEENTEGMKRLVVDTVLAFLTSNLKSTESVSYLVTRDVTEDSLSHDGDGFYEIGADPFE